MLPYPIRILLILRNKLGGIGLLWCLLWFILVTDEPTIDKYISRKEVAFIQQQVESIPREEVSRQFRNHNLRIIKN